MFVLYYFLISVFYLPLKFILLSFVNKFGKISYDDIDAFGFIYDSDNNLFYTSKYAWQKKFGYCSLYNTYAPLFQIIMDTEPIRFNYNNKNWLITFWKGQYGITTGAEVGIYYTNDKYVNKKTLYLPVSNDDLLNIKFTLYRKKNEIAKISDKHWWLGVFKLGMFSKPKDLTMDIELEFPNQEMLDAFLKSFKKLHHSKKCYSISNNIFKFTYKKAKHKVWTRGVISDFIRQHYNKKNVILYNKYMADIVSYDSNDKNIIKINDFIPDIMKNKNSSGEIVDK